MPSLQKLVPLTVAVLLLLISLCHTVSASAAIDDIAAKRTVAPMSTTSTAHGTSTTSKTKTKTKLRSKKTSTSSSSTSTMACSTTVTANFDTLSTGAAVPSDYPLAGATWSGFTVKTAHSLNLNASTSPNIIQSDSNAGAVNPGSSISYSQTPNGYTTLSLSSFSFGCTFFFEQLQSNDPTACSVIVVGAQNLFETSSPVNYAGPFTFGGCNYPYFCNLTTVTPDQLSAIAGSNVISFYVVGGLSEAQLVLDDLVFEADLINCS